MTDAPKSRPMTKYLLHLALTIVVTSNAVAQNPLSVSKPEADNSVAAELKSFTLAEGFEANLFADETDGVANGSSSIPLNQPFLGPLRRDGALDPNMSGPLGTTLSLRLADPATGIVLNSWVDADRTVKGGATTVIDP